MCGILAAVIFAVGILAAWNFRPGNFCRREFSPRGNFAAGKWRCELKKNISLSIYYYVFYNVKKLPRGVRM